MKASDIKQSVAHGITYMQDNPLLAVVMGVAILLVVLILGGLLLDSYLERKRERAKAKAVERLQKHLQSLPSSKS